jgi:CRP-like cAMP-binding protein
MVTGYPRSAAACPCIPLGGLLNTENFRRFLHEYIPAACAGLEPTLAHVVTRNLRKGEVFLEQGKIARQAAYIESGILRTAYVNAKGDDVTSCFCVANSLTTSYRSFVTQTASEFAITAMEDTTLLVIDYEAMQRLLIEDAVWAQIGRRIVEEEYFKQEKYAALLQNDAAKAKYLDLMRHQPQIIQRVPVHYIASYLGVTRRTLTRIRQAIKESI